MRVAFLHVGLEPEAALLPGIMVRSVKTAMPGAHILQMSDRKTPAVPGVDEIWREEYFYERLLEHYPGTVIPSGLMVFRMKMLAKLDDAPTVILDTDTFVQKDLSLAFEDDFEIGLTERAGLIKAQDGTNMIETMPYNTGVMFSRSGAFWKFCLAFVKTLGDAQKNWTGDQIAVASVSRQFKRRIFPVDPWNFSPARVDTDVADKHVVHYKGMRKVWMVQRAQQLGLI